MSSMRDTNKDYDKVPDHVFRLLLETSITCAVIATNIFTCMLSVAF